MATASCGRLSVKGLRRLADSHAQRKKKPRCRMESGAEYARAELEDSRFGLGATPVAHIQNRWLGGMFRLHFARRLASGARLVWFVRSNDEFQWPKI